ncbi:unnamed protein product [Penicillium salamii]|nr:unnamed protein product [Penicillium salamii]CAG8402287.1 unnamed protein product [Penicillium salamii]
MHYSTEFNGENHSLQVSKNEGTIHFEIHPACSAPVLPDLPFVEHAIFNHTIHEDRDQLRYCCPGTRTELLAKIFAWAESPEEKNIFVLNGWPGTGKTTIARTVAKRYADRTVSFIFRKGIQDCESYDKFVTTVASQLVEKSATIKQLVNDALKNDRSLLSQGLEYKWNRLILEPLKDLESTQTPFILVIDALDECQNGEWLFRKLTEEAPTCLRILITSRPHILPSHSKNDLWHQVVLHDIEPDIVNRDIILFLRETLKKHRQGWPDEDSLNLLAQRANGSFEWAALACRYIDDSDGVYENNMRKLLGDGLHHTPRAALSALYLTVLSNYVDSQKWDSDNRTTCRRLLRTYLGSLVVLFDQLPPRSFYSLVITDTGGRDIHAILRNLKSIIDAPNDKDNSINLIRIHHPTFREFLLDRELCTDDRFYVERKAAHGVVLNGCLDLLLNKLRRDMFSSQSPSNHDTDTEQPHPRQSISPEIQYACLYWVAHLVESSVAISEVPSICQFLSNHSLHWLEVLGWMGRTVEALDALDHLSSVAKCDYDSEISQFIADLTLFTRHNRAIMEENPAQLCVSGIIFAPAESLVRRRFQNEALRVVCKLPETRPRWDDCPFRSLAADGGDVQVLAFSECGSILASASSDFKIRLRNVLTGQLVMIFQDFEDPITAITFSKEPKCRFLASLSNRCVQIWDIENGCCVATLPNQQGYKAMAWVTDDCQLLAISYDCLVDYWNPEKVWRSDQRVDHGTSLIFSGDSKTFATWSAVDSIHIWSITDNVFHEKVALDDIGASKSLSLAHDGSFLAVGEFNIRIYDTDSGNLTSLLEGHLLKIRSVAFAPYSRLLASASNDGAVKLWNLSTRQCFQQLNGQKPPIMSLVFSDEGNLLASGSRDSTICLWDLSMIPKHKKQSSLQGGLDRVTKLAMAEMAHKVVVGFSHSHIHLYDIENGNSPLILKGHQAEISDLHFLEDGETLVSASLDGRIQLWDTTSGQFLKTFARYPAGIQKLVFTDDKKLLASILFDCTIFVWKFKNGTLPILAGHTDSIESAVFSQPDQILASSSRDKTIRIWDLGESTCLKTLTGHEGWVTCVVFMQNRITLASSSLDKTVRLWNVETGECLSILKHYSGVEAVAISADERVLACTLRKLVDIWDLSQEQRIQTLRASSQYVGLTSTGQYLLTNRGAIVLDLGFREWKPWEQPRSAIYVDREWILHKMQRVLWLPPRYRNSKFLMVRDKMVILVDDSGDMIALCLR